MIPRIKTIEAKDSYKLEVLFDDDKRVIYDVSDDIKNIESFNYEYGTEI